jgi:hypothetical protein
MLGEFNTPLSPIHRYPDQKNQTNEQTKTKKTLRMNWHYRPNGLNRHLQNILSSYSIIHILLSSPWKFHQNRHEASLSKCKEVEITPCILSDHNEIKIELKSKRNSRKYSNTWGLNNTLLNDQWVIKEIRGKIEKFLESNKKENTTY